VTLLWLVLSVLSAFFLATADALTKRFFSQYPAYVMGLVRLGYALPWFLASFLFIPLTVPTPTFWVAVACALPLEVGAFILYMRAIKISPLSLTLPFLSFTPVFIVFTGWLFLGERVSGGAAAGIVCIVIGTWTLHFSKGRQGILEPFRAVIRERGSLLMILVSLIYAVTAPLGKLAIINSDPLFFGAVYFTILAVLLILLAPLTDGKRTFKTLNWRSFPAGEALGLCVFLSALCHFQAVALTNVAHMIAVKRMSILFGVLYGAWLFREEEIGERLVGSLIMIGGVFLIARYA